MRRENQYCRKEKDRKRRIYEQGKYNTCTAKKCWRTRDEMPVEEFLKEDGKDWELMKRIDRVREKRKKEGGKEEAVQKRKGRQRNTRKDSTNELLSEYIT